MARWYLCFALAFLFAGVGQGKTQSVGKKAPNLVPEIVGKHHPHGPRAIRMPGMRETALSPHQPAKTKSTEKMVQHIQPHSVVQAETQHHLRGGAAADPNLRHRVRKDSLKNGTRSAEEGVWPLDPWDWDPADEYFGTYSASSGKSTNASLKALMAGGTEKKREHVDEARETVIKAILEVNQLNKIPPIAKTYAGPFWVKLFDQVKDLGKPKPQKGPTKPTVPNPIEDGPSTLVEVPKPFKWNPVNFRHIYWVYVFLATMWALKHPTIHLLGFLPWAFYFANRATKVITWDEEFIPNKIG